MKHEIGQIISRLIKKYGISEGELNGYLGFDAHDIITGEAVPTPDQIVQLSVTLKVTTDYLLGKSPDPNPVFGIKNIAKETLLSEDCIKEYLESRHDLASLVERDILNRIDELRLINSCINDDRIMTAFERRCPYR